MHYYLQKPYDNLVQTQGMLEQYALKVIGRNQG